MGTHDRRVDAYIAKSPDFARPVLEQLRAAVHAACPDVAETIKWRMPFFVHGGPLCYMAAFKRHCAFGFWKGKLLVSTNSAAPAALGQFGRITSKQELPPRRTLVALVRKAVKLNHAGVPSPTRGKAARRPAPRPPADLGRALASNAKARATFAALPPSGKREYVESLSGAKRAETRERRLGKTVAALAAGRRLNAKYGG